MLISPELAKLGWKSVLIVSVGNDTPLSMADPWSTVPELRLNLGVYILCMVGGLVGNIMLITVMVREKTSRTFHADTWKTNLFLLSLTVSNLYQLELSFI